MAEFLIIPRTKGPNPRYQDGDIVYAMNNRMIQSVHIQHICHYRNQILNSDGYFDTSSLYFDLLSNVYQYKFERISRNEIRRTDLVTLDEEVFSDQTAQSIDVQLYIQRRIDAGNRKIFGTKNSEIWFGGKFSPSQPNLNSVWDQIEVKSANQRTDSQFQKWPVTPTEKRKLLALDVADFTDQEFVDFTIPDIEVVGDDEILKQKRLRAVNWRSLSIGVNESDVLDESKEIDVRDIRADRVSSLIVKSPIRGGR